MSPEKLNYRFILRHLTLFGGIFLQILLLLTAYEGQNLTVVQVVLSLWMVAPFIVFVVLAKNLARNYLILISSLCLLIIHSLLILPAVINRDTAPIPIVFFFTPIYELPAFIPMLLHAKKSSGAVIALIVLLFFGYIGHGFYLRKSAKNPNASPARLRQIHQSLRTQNSQAIMLNLAKNRNTPSDILYDLATKGDRFVVSEIGRHPNTSSRTLVKIGNSTKDYIQLIHVATNPKTPMDTLWKLSERTSKDWVLAKERYLWEYYKKYVFSGLAKNPNSPVELLIKVSDSCNKDIAVSLAQNPKTPCKVLKRLLGCKDKVIAYYVRASFAGRCE